MAWCGLGSCGYLIDVGWDRSPEYFSDLIPNITGPAFFQFLHFTPQHKFVFFLNKTFGVDLLLCQDNWTRSVERLREYLKPTVLPADIVRRHKRRTEHSKCSGLPEEIRRRIEAAYAMDMCLFFPNKSETACGPLTAGQLTGRYKTCMESIGDKICFAAARCVELQGRHVLGIQTPLQSAYTAYVRIVAIRLGGFAFPVKNSNRMIRFLESVHAFRFDSCCGS